GWPQGSSDAPGLAVPHLFFTGLGPKLLVDPRSRSCYFLPTSQKPGAHQMNVGTPRILAVCALVSFLSFTSCSKSKSGEARSGEQPPSASPAPGSALVAHPFKDLRDVRGTVFDVSYTPQTVRIGESAWRSSLKSVSSDG